MDGETAMVEKMLVTQAFLKKWRIIIGREENV